MQVRIFLSNKAGDGAKRASACVFKFYCDIRSQVRIFLSNKAGDGAKRASACVFKFYCDIRSQVRIFLSNKAGNGAERASACVFNSYSQLTPTTCRTCAIDKSVLFNKSGTANKCMGSLPQNSRLCVTRYLSQICHWHIYSAECVHFYKLRHLRQILLRHQVAGSHLLVEQSR